MSLGQNAKENWDLFRKAKQTDYWFHLDNSPSGHAFVSNINKDIIRETALLVKNNSKFKHLKNVSVIYCQKRNLKLGNKEGEIIIRSKKKCKIIKV
jgi:predicted ribosome quality control (RQC) complex YloA/Tae2 family protein